MIVRLLKIKKENDRSFTAVMNDLENIKQIENIVKDRMSTGKIHKPRTSYDNYNCYLDDDIEVKKEDIKPYHKDLVKSNKKDRSSMIIANNDLDQQLDNFESLNVQEIRYEMTAIGDDDEDLPFDPEQARTGMSPEPDLTSSDEYVFRLPKPDSQNVSSFLDKSGMV